MHHCGSLALFLTEFKAIVENRLRCRKYLDTIVPLPQFYNDLITDIELLGWNRLSFLDASFRELHLVSHDVKKRMHTLKIQIHHQHPQKSPEFQSELPAPFQFNWNSQSKFCHVFDEFEKSVHQYEEFWNIMDEMDANTCVLEPEKPTRNSTRRRIALDRAASLQLEIDPRHPTFIPDIRFLGADSFCGSLKEKLANNLCQWNINYTLLKNLQKMLEIEFPSLKNSKKEDFTLECGICYCYNLEDEIPDQVCDDLRCKQIFHRTCLCEWLRSLSTSRQSFNLLFGDCPLCNTPMTVKIIS